VVNSSVGQIIASNCISLSGEIVIDLGGSVPDALNLFESESDCLSSNATVVFINAPECMRVDYEDTSTSNSFKLLLSQSDTCKSLSTGVVVGIAIAVAVAVAALLSVLLIWRRRRALKGSPRLKDLVRMQATSGNAYSQQSDSAFVNSNSNSNAYSTNENAQAKARATAVFENSLDSPAERRGVRINRATINLDPAQLDE
jgi:hypothetical protein